MDAEPFCEMLLLMAMVELNVAQARCDKMRQNCTETSQARAGCHTEGRMQLSVEEFGGERHHCGTFRVQQHRLKDSSMGLQLGESASQSLDCLRNLPSVCCPRKAVGDVRSIGFEADPARMDLFEP